MTFSELFEEYCAVKKTEVRESTLHKMRRTIRIYVMPVFETDKLKDINLVKIRKWKTDIDQKDLTLKTKQGIYGEFRAVLNYAVRMEYTPKNIICTVGNFKSTLQIKKEFLYYTPEEFKKFISTAKENAEKAQAVGKLREWDYYVFFAIAYYMGMRKGEIYALEWRDIKHGYIHITRSITQKLPGGDRETAPKSKTSIRTIQVPLLLMVILNEHRERCKGYSGFGEHFKVCGGVKCLRDAQVSDRNKNFAEKSGVKRIRIHDFRHSHASVLANNGVNIQEIARRLGHSNVEITWNTYSHLYPKEEERATDILNKIL